MESILVKEVKNSWIAVGCREFWDVASHSQSSHVYN